ncbi:MAG TPA: c-type cytochrome [Paracoccaceae bacterium]|nr:c-type cytochrome [Paracoccaceae bacterium]HMO70425.1 c-type cytochrome [Paracoccaceae bacterium]
MRMILAAAAAVLTAAPALAAGDAANGEKLFGQCQTCHVVQNEAGETLAGRNSRTGPNLYGVIGRQAGSVEGFRYQASIVKAGEEGLVWDEAELAAYLLNPPEFLKARLGDPRARSGMAHRVRNDGDAADLVAFLASFAPAAEEAAEGEADAEAPASN